MGPENENICLFGVLGRVYATLSPQAKMQWCTYTLLFLNLNVPSKIVANLAQFPGSVMALRNFKQGKVPQDMDTWKKWRPWRSRIE